MELPQEKKKNNKKRIWAPVVHTCNLSYSGDRDQEDHGLKPAWAHSHKTLFRKYLTQKGLVLWLKV
jgi:hypothetical protein